MNRTNYINTVQHFIQQLFHHIQQTNKQTNKQTNTKPMAGKCLYTRTQANDSKSRAEKMGLEGRFKRC